MTSAAVRSPVSHPAAALDCPVPEGWTLRRAGLGDVDAICALGNELNAAHALAAPFHFAPVGEHRRDAVHWCAAVASDFRAAFVAEFDGRCQGFVTCAFGTETSPMVVARSFGRVNSVCVTEAARGQGIGRALIETAQSWARQQGASEMRLDVWAFNADAVRLYEAMGFEVRSLAMGKPL